MATVTKGAPGKEIGAEAQHVGGFNGWASFVDEQETVPELSWPQSVPTYHKMRSESQIEALHLGTTMPVREYRWAINPNGAPATVAERAAQDFGLPIRGEEDGDIPRSRLSFDFDSFLTDALLSPLYGFMHFEIVGSVNPAATEWHVDKLAPRHPRTIMNFRTAPTGELLGIQQNISGAQGFMHTPSEIRATKLVPFVWRSEAGSHVGRSMLRSLYREWLVKDRTIRVAAINIERAGGMPVVEGPQNASDAQLRDLATLARQFKVAEGGGGAIPFGSKLHLVGGSAPAAIDLLKYCDEAMARVWALMLVQLGTTQTGNRALGTEFADYAGRAQRSMAGWICGVFNRLLDQYVEYNLGSDATHAPQLVFEPSKPGGASLDQMVALADAGLLVADPELLAWIRSEANMPKLPEGYKPPAPPPAPAQLPPGPPVTTQAANGRRYARTTVQAGMTLRDGRELRRQPYEQEVRAAVDFNALDLAHETVYAQAESLYLQRVIPSQIASLSAAIETTKAGTPRKRLTRSAMAKLAAGPEGREDLVAILAAAAKSGAHAAMAELASQGLASEAPADADLEAIVADQADALTDMAANGISLSAQRRATSLVGSQRSIGDVATDVRAHLSGMKHQWTMDQLHGAVTSAQNAGRTEVFASASPGAGALRYYASEILDANCCEACTDVDGTEYSSLQDSSRDYPGGGFVDCAGGPRCRGTLVAVYYEQDPLSSSNPVVPALA